MIIVRNIDETINDPNQLHHRILSLGEQVGELVDRELIELSRILDDFKNPPLSDLVEVGPDMAINKNVRIDGMISRRNSKSYFLNFAIKRGVPSALLLLCPTGYSTEISSRTVPSFNSMVMAFPMDRLSGSWYSVEKASS